MAREWTWIEDRCDFDELGNYVRLHYYVFAGAPRPPEAPTDLTWLRRVETPSMGGGFTWRHYMGTPETPEPGNEVASQAVLVAAYNATQPTELQLQDEPLG